MDLQTGYVRTNLVHADAVSWYHSGDEMGSVRSRAEDAVTKSPQC